MIERREEFKREVENEKERALPSTELEVLRERINLLKIRIHFSERVFLDIYFNSQNGRTDYALIEKEKRVFGVITISAPVSSRHSRSLGTSTPEKTAPSTKRSFQNP